MSDNNEKTARAGLGSPVNGDEGTPDNTVNATGAPSGGDAGTQESAAKPSAALPASGNRPPSSTPDLRNILPKIPLPNLKRMTPKYAVPERLNNSLREVNHIGSIFEEQSRFAKHLDLFNGSTAIRVLDEFNNSATARAVRQLDKLQFPAGSAVDDIVNGYRRHFEKQLQPIQELLKNHHTTAHLASFRDSFATQYGNSYVLNDTARQFARLDQQATAALADAAAVKLRAPEFHAFVTLRDSLNKDSDVAALIRSFQTPWAKLDDLLGSAIGVAEASILFDGVHNHNPFDDRITEYLRFEFGDYRDAGNWDEDLVQESTVRLEIYREMGLREELRDTPREVLVEAESKIVIPRPAANILTPFSFCALFTSDDLEPYLMACKALRILERRLRDVIDTEMTKVYGANWIMSTLKKEIRDAWIEKQEKAVKQGRPKDPLIEYADFSEYSLIITGKPQWEGVFKFIFKRQEDVRESLYRLGPVRIAAFHSREVLDMDILALAAEGTRLMRALGIAST